MSNVVKWFEELDGSDLATVGGKGANLGELTQAGIPVPPGYVVMTDVYKELVARGGISALIEQEFEGLDYKDEHALEAAALKVREAILDMDLPSDTEQEIVDAYAALGGGYVAVRSSATAEDQPDASFAGQQATFLNIISRNALLRAVKACIASLYTPRAAFYRDSNNYDHETSSLAVVVQQMINSKVAGVMFTMDPVTGRRDHIVIEAVHGLGEALVGGQQTPDKFVVAKTAKGLEIISRIFGNQESMLVRAEGSPEELEEFNVWMPVPPELLAKPALSDDQILELARIGISTSNHYDDEPRDTEWAMDENDVLYLTQARPVTATGQASGVAELPEPAKILLEGTAVGPRVGYGKVKILQDPSEADSFEDGEVLVTRFTTPDWVAIMVRASAIITEIGGATSHAAILAREKEIPCTVGVKGAMSALSDGQCVTVDGAKGVVYEGEAKVRLQWFSDHLAAIKSIVHVKTRTKVCVISSDFEKAARAATEGANGIGLCRLEFIIEAIGVHPRWYVDNNKGDEYVEALVAGLTPFCEAYQGEGQQVIVRAADLKSNEYKKLKYGDLYELDEENPMLGLRGALRYIFWPEVFGFELKAMLRLKQLYPNIRLMIPFVHSPEEFSQVMDMVRAAGLNPGKEWPVYMMAELPTNAFQIDEFVKAGAGGFSIGSNDLTQLGMGTDRDGVEQLRGVASEMNPGILEMIKMIIQACKRNGVPVGICGQGPSNSAALVRFLLELGIDSVSVTPDVYLLTLQLIAQIEQEMGILPEQTMAEAEEAFEDPAEAEGVESGELVTA